MLGLVPGFRGLASWDTALSIGLVSDYAVANLGYDSTHLGGIH